MGPYDLTSPRHLPGMTLTARFFDEEVRYAEDYANLGRVYGMIPAPWGKSRCLAHLEGVDLLRLPSIAAIGVNGSPLLVSPDDPGPGIRPFDLSRLEPGRHRIYVCLSQDRTPCGPLKPLLVAGQVEDQPVHSRSQSSLALAAGEDRARFRDWLAVAEVVVSTRAGVIQVQLDPDFHPAVRTMEAYAHENPLRLLAEAGLAALESHDREETGRFVRVELNLLRNLADAGSPEGAFAQAQRCLGLLREAALPSLALDGRLEGMRYHPDSFCNFLAALRLDLKERRSAELFPAVIELEGQPHLRLVGELTQNQEFWSWSAPHSGFVASSLALYLPRAIADRIPVVLYGRREADAPQFAVARVAEQVAGPGAAVLFEGLKERVDRVVLRAAANNQFARMQMHLGNGHALYYR